jgi:hypothetical protein
MLSNLIKRTRALGNVEILVKADGSYPVKNKTKVQHVDHYQNDGTKYIKASKYVQRAEKSKRAWRTPIFRSVGRWLFFNEFRPMEQVAKRIALDIVSKVDRVDTGRLRANLKGRVNRR